MNSFMARWSMRKFKCWRPGLDHIDPRVICVNCVDNSWYDNDSKDAVFQMNGQYLCKGCRVTNPIKLALCQSIPYEVLTILMINRSPTKVTDVMWDFKQY
jgi:hypothetical protein